MSSERAVMEGRDRRLVFVDMSYNISLLIPALDALNAGVIQELIALLQYFNCRATELTCTDLHAEPSVSCDRK